MSEKIKILLSVGSLGMGGNEIFVMNLFRNLNKQQFQVDFVIYDNHRLEFYDEVINTNSNVYFCTGTVKNSIVRIFQEMYNTYRVLKSGQYDVLHCHSCSFVGLFRGALPGFFIKKTKIITHSHSASLEKKRGMGGFVRKLLRIVLVNLIDYGFSCSDVAGKSKYTDNFLESTRYYIINNAVDSERYMYSKVKREEIRKQLNIDLNTLVMGHVGRFEMEKNHTFLLDIFAQIKEMKPDSKLMLVGDGSLLEEMKKRAQDLGVSEAVLFMGHQASAAPYYQAMDCFVMPSLYEGFPFVLVEAQINGLKCVVADTITSSVNISGGVQFESLEKSAKDWAKSIIHIGQMRMESNQIKEVCLRYDLKNETQRIEALYQKLVLQ